MRQDYHDGAWVSAMRTFLPLGCMLLGVTFGFAQPVDSGSHPLACVQTLALPTQGVFAPHASSSAAVRVMVTIGEGGRVKEAVLRGGDKILQAEVKAALELSEFRTDCASKTEEITFSFKLIDPPVSAMLPPAVRFIPPNTFEIVYRRIRPRVEWAVPR